MTIIATQPTFTNFFADGKVFYMCYAELSVDDHMQQVFSGHTAAQQCLAELTAQSWKKTDLKRKDAPGCSNVSIHSYTVTWKCICSLQWIPKQNKNVQLKHIYHWQGVKQEADLNWLCTETRMNMVLFFHLCTIPRHFLTTIISFSHTSWEQFTKEEVLSQIHLDFSFFVAWEGKMFSKRKDQSISPSFSILLMISWALRFILPTVGIWPQVVNCWYRQFQCQLYSDAFKRLVDTWNIKNDILY